MDVDTLIIGGGAAGLAAACFSSADTLVLERLSTPGQKIRATGGGRSNFTHDADAAGLAATCSRCRRFVLPAFHHFPPCAIRAFFAEQGVPNHVEADGCVFPDSQRASDVVAALMRVAQQRGAEIRTGVEATGWTVAGHDAERRMTCVETSVGQIYPKQIILAAGGKSYPDLGSNGSGFMLAEQAGLKVEPPVPGLAGLQTVETWPNDVAGIVCEQGRVWLDEKGGEKQAHEGPILFTHRGISGPPALALSGEINVRLRACAQNGCGTPSVAIRFSIQHPRMLTDWLTLFGQWRQMHGNRAVHNLLSGEMPRGLAQVFCQQVGLAHKAMAQVSRLEMEQLAHVCCSTRVSVSATEGWNRAMVTRGGIALDQVDPKTLRCKTIANLFCVGEVLDIDFPCGGYNLSWAFASGRLAADHIRTVASVNNRDTRPV